MKHPRILTLLLVICHIGAAIAQSSLDLKELGFYTVIQGASRLAPLKPYPDGSTKRPLPAADFPTIPTLTTKDYFVLFGDMPSVMGMPPSVLSYRRQGAQLVFAGAEQPVEAFFSIEPLEGVKGQKVLKLTLRDGTKPGLYLLHKYVGMNGDAYFPFEVKH